MDTTPVDSLPEALTGPGAVRPVDNEDVAQILASTDLLELLSLRAELIQVASSRRLWGAFGPALILAIASVTFTPGEGGDDTVTAGVAVFSLFFLAVVLYLWWLFKRMAYRRRMGDHADEWRVVVEHRLAELAARPESR